MTFPANTESSTLDYATICEGWAHCFRAPERFLPPQQPRILLSLSDFIDPVVITPYRFAFPNPKQVKFDFVYVCADEAWKMKAKNWPLAEKCLSRLCGQLGLRGLIVGADPKAIPTLPNLVISPWLPYESFLHLLANSRFLFVPNELDASPRVLAEALCLNIPILVNRTLIGGWKYVTPATGVFFDDEHNVVPRARYCLTNDFRPRSWYLSQFGPRRAGRVLLDLIRQIDPAYSGSGPLGLSYSFSPYIDNGALVSA